MRILKTCLKAGHRWSRPLQVPIQGVRYPAEEGWTEVRICLRQLCARHRVDFTDLSAVTYFQSEEGPTDIHVVSSN